MTGQPQKILPLPGRIAGASGGYAPSLLLSNLSCGVLPTSMLNGWLVGDQQLFGGGLFSSFFPFPVGDEGRSAERKEKEKEKEKERDLERQRHQTGYKQNTDCYCS